MASMIAAKKWNQFRMDDVSCLYHGNFRWTGQPPLNLFGCLLASVRFGFGFGFIQSHALGFFDLDDFGVVDDDLNHPVTERFDVLDDQFKPLRIFVYVFSHIVLPKVPFNHNND
jgi:hypothetical protein